MAPRTSWKGFLKLSLISIPVKAFTAHETSESVRLNQLHRDCHQRVRYQKVCPEHGELQSKDIVSGYEFSKDEYVVVDPAEIAKLRPESDRSVKIHGFVPLDEIDPIYQAGKTYLLLPDGIAGDKPYALLHKGMRDAGVAGIANMVIANREQLVMLRTMDDLLVISILHVAKKVKALAPFLEGLRDMEVTREEVNLTNTLIEASRIEDFDFGQYKDEYVERLTALIQLKIEGQEIVQAPDVEEPKILNLMDALMKSVAEAQAGGRVAGGKRMAASKKGAKKKAAQKGAKKGAKKATASRKPVRRRKSG